MSETAPWTPRHREEIAPIDLPGLNGLMTLAVCVVVVVALYIAREIFIPVTLAVLLSFVLAPLVRVLRGWRLGRLPSVAIAALVAVGLIAVVSIVIGSQIAQLAGDVPRYTSTIEGKVSAARDLVGKRVFEVIGNIGRRMEIAERATVESRPEGGQPAPHPPMPVELHQPPPSPFEVARQILVPVLAPLANAGIVFIVAIFILLQQEDLRDRVIRLFGTDDLHRSTRALDDAGRRLSRYFLTQLGLNTALGIIIGIGLLAVGVPNPVLWGIVAALFRFVPYVGTHLAAGLPLLLAAAVDPGWTMLAWTMALFLVAELTMGQVVDPMVYGRSTGLSPVSVVIAAIFWGWLWGPVGLILSMPLTLCLVVLGRHVPRLKFIDVVLGDRPALTPVESFYQRMLAGDPDEALDAAEVLLRDRPLAAYYDEIGIKGLLLAANDSQRGLLTVERTTTIEDALEELVSQLAEHEDELAQPPITGHAMDESKTSLQPIPILCIAGRGPFDRGATTMLAQLLERTGMKARVASHGEAARGNIRSLEVEGISVICLCYLEISGSPSHLRYLLRRLRSRVPDIPILVGIWPTDETSLNDERLRSAVQADYFATSLRDAVIICGKVIHDDYANLPPPLEVIA